jgi:Tfp pilus assembly protein PilF
VSRRCAALAGLLLAACAAPPQPQPSPAPSGLADLMERPAERSLFEGIRAYDDGNYAAAETALRKALGEGLKSGRDQATAHKLLAFITCTSERVPACEDAFKAARAADPAFVLSRSEAGHPLWGPVYKRVLP